ncbi:MAG: nucleotide exchange factor GrpE [Rhizobiaceae bacterium]
MPDNAEHHDDDAANENSAPADKKSKTRIEVENLEREFLSENDDGPGEEREGFSDPLEFLSAELDRLEAEKAELQEKALRVAADMENLRRRTQKDVADARSFSISSFAREMLAVYDNLQRALQAIPQEARDAGDDGFKALIEGVELTERSMMQALEKNGVKRISPLNEKFDPNFHQAMFEIPDETVPNNTVLQVVQDGFIIGERCLRPAMVGVSRGGPKQASKAPETAEGDNAEEIPNEDG